jgi:membrane associated rhomboid family serine protease
MGIYDRDYYRREGPSYLESLIPSGQVCKWLIVINVGIWILQVVTIDRRPPEFTIIRDVDGNVVHAKEPAPRTGFTELFYLDPPKITHGQVWRLLTYAFLHSQTSWTHVFFNMLFLWWFGSELERMYGPKEFLAFYLVAAFVGGVTDVVFYLVSGNPTPGLGASGAVTALLVLFALHFPHQQIRIMFLLPVPIWLFVLFQIAQDTFGALEGFVHFKATAAVVHLSGAVFGFLYFQQHWHILGLLQSFGTWKMARPRQRLRLYRPENSEGQPVSVASVGPSNHLDEHLEAKLDAVLEKVARFGQDSLTDAERQILLKASEIYKRKRS